MIYLYGLVQGPFSPVAAALADTQGLQGPIRLIQFNGWTLIYSDHDNQEILPKRRLLLTHAKVLEHVLSLGTVLPARFGLVAETLEQVTALIETRASTIQSEFDKVSGGIELGVRVSFARDAALAATLDANATLSAARDALRSRGPEAHFAMAEFGGKLAEHLDRRRGAAQRKLISALRPLCRDHVLRSPETDAEVLRVEFLIDKTQQETFQTAVATAATELDFAPGCDPAIQIIGPVPMYNFVRLNLAFDPDQAAA